MTLDTRFPRLRLGALTRRFTMSLAAGAVALTGLAAASRPAQADADDLLRFLAGAIIVGAIVNAIDDNQTPRYAGRWQLPDSCLETVRVRGRNVEVYNGRCLSRAGYNDLPQYCARDFNINGRNRTGYVAECLYDAGYGREGYRQPPRYEPPQYQPPQYQPPGYPPYGSPPPYFNPGRPPHTSVQPPSLGFEGRLPSHCAMTYRQSGQRVDGYWANCLNDAGFDNLPRHCRVSASDGSRIYTAQCLLDAGYRRSRR